MIEPEPQNMVASISNSAMVVYSLAQRDPGSALLADAVRYLMATARPIRAGPPPMRLPGR